MPSYPINYIFYAYEGPFLDFRGKMSYIALFKESYKMSKKNHFMVPNIDFFWTFIKLKFNIFLFKIFIEVQYDILIILSPNNIYRSLPP